MRYICENDHIFEHTAKMTTCVDDIVYEIPVCPHCYIKTYAEHVIDTKITSVISVELDKVDAKLAEGYEVESLYAKTATLVKKAIA